MADNADERDLKLLDRALDRHAAEKQVFSRDLKIVSLVFAVLLFGVFFRYIRLSDEKLELAGRLEQTKKAQETLETVNRGLATMSDLLQQRGKETAAAIERGKETLRSRIVEFLDLVANLPARELPESSAADPERPANVLSPFYSPSPERPATVANVANIAAPHEAPAANDSTQPSLSVTQQSPRANIAQQSSPSTGPAAALQYQSAPRNADLPEALRGLSLEERRMFKDKEAEAFDPFIRSLVNRRIVPPVFDELNRKKAEQLDVPIDDAVAALKPLLTAASPVSATIGWDPATILKALEALSAGLHKVRIVPPPDGNWWRSVQSKGAFFATSSLDAGLAFDHLGEELGTMRESVKKVEGNLASLVAEASANKAALDAESDKLTKDYDEVQSSIAGLARPLALVALRLETIVPYAPVLLSGAVILFLWRFGSLRRKESALARACRELGYSDRVIEVCFDERIPATGASPRVRSGSPAQWLTPILFAAPGLLAIWAGIALLRSPSLSSQAPTTIYGATAVALAVAYALAAPAGFLSLRLNAR